MKFILHISLLLLLGTQVFGSSSNCQKDYKKSLDWYQKAKGGGRNCGATQYFYEMAYEKMNETIQSCKKIKSVDNNNILIKLKVIIKKLETQEKIVGGPKYCQWLFRH